MPYKDQATYLAKARERNMRRYLALRSDPVSWQAYLASQRTRRGQNLEKARAFEAEYARSRRAKLAAAKPKLCEEDIARLKQNSAEQRRRKDREAKARLGREEQAKRRRDWAAKNPFKYRLANARTSIARHLKGLGCDNVAIPLPLLEAKAFQLLVRHGAAEGDTQ